MNSFDRFLKLHQGKSPLLIGNIWSVHSAKIFERNGFAAVATSSAAVANTFGYNDGQQIPFDLLVDLAKRVNDNITIPLSVDIESGFGRTPEDIFENIKRLCEAGVSGVNLEDSLIDGERKLQDTVVFQKLLARICKLLDQHHLKMFLNIRTDAFLLGMPNATSETMARIAAYGACNIHGVFVPCITNSSDIEEVVNSTGLPVNVMSMPHLPDFATLKKLGVKRISMGNALHQSVYSFLENQVQAIKANNNFNVLF